MTSKPTLIKIETYNKLQAMKIGERDSFTKVIEHILTENKRLTTENERLNKENEEYIKELLTIKKSIKKKV